MELDLLAVDAESIGYGRLGVKLRESLVRRGVDVYDDLNVPTGHQNHLSEQVDGRRHKKTNVVAWVSTPGHANGWWDGQIPVILTMWEAQRLPEAYREHLHHFDTVIVPSQQNLELFSEYHPNVKLATLGVDPAQWHFEERKQPGQNFTFLIGGSGARKGTDLAYRAFLTAFPDGSWGDGPIPRLMMKNPKGEDFYHSRVDMVSGRISAAAEVALYANAHCYLQPSRGEGFGLQPIQAIAQGMPTILTAAHGHSSFAHLGYGLSTTAATASYFIYGDAGDWWEPDFDELVGYMRYVYDNYDAAQAFAKESAAVVARDFTWDQCARQFIEAIGEDRLSVPYQGDGVTWVKPEAKLYMVVTNVDYKADIAGSVYLFRRGETYYEPSDVKRIMFEAGVLDAACLETFQAGLESGPMDTGLTPDQVERAGFFSASASFCDRCGQQANTAPTNADLLFEHGEKMRAKMAEYGLSDEQVSAVMNVEAFA